ncbi:hypothetical protein BLOT_014162, partial [Blomia tropicalis]
MLIFSRTAISASFTSHFIPSTPHQPNSWPKTNKHWNTFDKKRMWPYTFFGLFINRFQRFYVLIVPCSCLDSNGSM